MSRRLLSILVYCLCLGLAIVLICRLVDGFPQFVDLLFHFHRLPPFFYAFGLYFAAQLLGAWRWRILLRPPNLVLSYWQAFRLTLAGNFFSLVIPGGVSGDIVKVGVATGAHPGKAPELALVDLLDRCIGLAGLFAVAFLAIPLLYRSPFVVGSSGEGLHKLLRSATIASTCMLLAALVVYLLWLLQPKFRNATRFSSWKRFCPAFVRRLAARFWASLELYRGRQAALWKAFALSMVIHLILGLELFFLQEIFYDVWDSSLFLPILFITQLANASAILPITPGGLGVRDTVVATLLTIVAFDSFDSTDAKCVALLNTVILVLWALVGAFLYLVTPNPQYKVPESSEAQPDEVA